MLARNSSFGFWERWSVCRQKPNVSFERWQKISCVVDFLFFLYRLLSGGEKSGIFLAKNKKRSGLYAHLAGLEPEYLSLTISFPSCSKSTPSTNLAQNKTTYKTEFISG